MNVLVLYTPFVIFGLLLGTMFFGGLWLTVRKIPQSSYPIGMFLLSAVLRSVLVLGGIWLVARSDPWAIGSCLLGFVVARILVTRVCRVGKDNPTLSHTTNASTGGALK